MRKHRPLESRERQHRLPLFSSARVTSDRSLSSLARISRWVLNHLRSSIVHSRVSDPIERLSPKERLVLACVYLWKSIRFRAYAGAKSMNHNCDGYAFQSLCQTLNTSLGLCCQNTLSRAGDEQNQAKRPLDCEEDHGTRRG